MKCSQQCEQPKCRKVCTETCVVGKPDVRGGRECKTECVEDCGEPKPAPAPEPVIEPKVEEIDYIPAVEEKGGVEVENKAIAPQIEETGGVKDSFRKYENCIDEDGNVISDAAARLLMTTGSTLTAMLLMPSSALLTGRRTQN